jgi:molecular chaperone GrpE
MSSTVSADLDYRPSYLAAGIASGLVLLLYIVTLAPSTAMWDTSEYIAAAYILGLPHPPGNPFFVLIGKFFTLLPIAGSIAARVNILAAVSSAVSAGMWFLITERVLVSWFPQRWQRIVGGSLAALIGATAFTVWSQSVVNEKVYTVSLAGLALVAWLTVRWCDDPDGPKADRLLVLVAYLLGLGYANHMAGMLAAPAVAIAVLIRRPRTLLRPWLIAACLGGGLLGITPFATQPIRAAYFPAINEGEPTAPEETPAPEAQLDDEGIAGLAQDAGTEAPETAEAPAAQEPDFKDLYLRAAAETENVRKRARRDVELAQARGVARLARELLPSLDNLDRALAHAEAEEADAEHHLTKGIRLVQQDLLGALTRVGIEQFSPQGEPFDPHQHEAVAQQPIEGAAPGTVAQVYQPGYRYKEEILRAAKVVVAA